MKQGFYWVKLYNKWTIGSLWNDHDTWAIIGSDEIFTSNDFQEIGHKIELP